MPTHTFLNTNDLSIRNYAVINNNNVTCIALFQFSRIEHPEYQQELIADFKRKIFSVIKS